MPRDLAVLLVEEGAVSPEEMARAVARRGEAGGSLDTALVELGLVAEEHLLDALARASELPAAPADAWTASDARARRVFPSRVAERHGLAPFALDGRELALVATHPVDLGVLDEISFMLSLHLAPHVGPEWRVRELIHRLYGTPLPERFAALAGYPASEAGDVGGVPDGDAPGRADEDVAAEDSRPEIGDPAPVPPADVGAAEATGAPPYARGFGADDAEPLEPLAAALAEVLEATDWDATADEPPAAPLIVGDAAPSGADAGADDAGPAQAAAGPRDRTAPPRWTLEDARAALAAARDRDEVVLAALRFTRDFFEFAAVFAVARDAVAGHDALGPDEDARDRCRGVAIYSSDPGMFQTVLEAPSPYLGSVELEAAGNAAILRGLGRADPRTVLVYPIVLRDRPVCILYADNGEAPVSHRRLGDLLVFLSTVGGAFERIIRERKRRRPRVSAAPPSGAAAAPAPASAAPEEPWRATEPARAPPPPPPAEIDVDLGDYEVAASTKAAVDAPVDVPSAIDALVASPRRSEARARLVAFLAAHADDAAPLLCARLPGPLEADAPDAPAAELGPVPAALSALGARAVRPLLEAAGADDPARRCAAVAILGGLAHPDAWPVLADRALDADDGVAAAARAGLAAGRRDAALRIAPEKLRRALLSGLSLRSAQAARALGALRDSDAIPLLIQALETSDPATAEAAAEALAAITLQRLGTSARRWLGWWKENRGRGRAEWLFSGLTSDDREVRLAAEADLRAAAPPPVEYSVDLAPAEREAAARAWAGFWARSGQVL